MENLNKYLPQKNEKEVIKSKIVEFLKARYNRKSDFNKFVLENKIVLFQSLKIKDPKSEEVGIIILGLQFSNNSKEIEKLKSFIVKLEDITNSNEGNKLELALSYGRELLEERDHRMIGPIWFNEKENHEISFLNKENISLVYFSNEIELLKNEKGETFSTSMISLSDVLDNKMFIENRGKVGFEKENTLEQELLIELLIKTLGVKYDYRLESQEYKIRDFIEKALKKKNIQIPFSLDLLKDNTIEDERDGSASGLFYLNGKLTGILNTYIRKYNQDYSYTIFSEHKKALDDVLNKLIEDLEVKKFIEKLKEEYEDNGEQLYYASIEEFNKNPLDFIERNSYYVFSGKEL